MWGGDGPFRNILISITVGVPALVRQIEYVLSLRIHHVGARAHPHQRRHHHRIRAPRRKVQRRAARVTAGAADVEAKLLHHGLAESGRYWLTQQQYNI
jgi:hypothetical protein